MKSLIVEDDFTCRLLLQKLLEPFGVCHAAADGEEALQAFESSRAERGPYDLICLDIMMPGMDGHEVLHRIRETETQSLRMGLHSSKVVMVTALNDKSNVFSAFREQCDGYLTKPIQKQKLIQLLTDLQLFNF
ncbi:MAG TPA: response regulator [Fibrobacteraceae bacterium]|nr:response regulator [Fibrobacteraceae bacterium]